jgi:hypothetical protein
VSKKTNPMLFLLIFWILAMLGVMTVLSLLSNKIADSAKLCEKKGGVHLKTYNGFVCMQCKEVKP